MTEVVKDFHKTQTLEYVGEFLVIWFNEKSAKFDGTLKNLFWLPRAKRF